MNDYTHYELHFKENYYINYQEPNGEWYKTEYKNIRGRIPRIEYNTTKYKNYIIIDIDKIGNLYNFESLNIPKPNFIVKNRNKDTGHLFYVLNRTITQNEYFLSLWKTTQKYFNIFLGGDPLFGGYKGKNLNNNVDFEFIEIYEKPYNIKDLFLYVKDLPQQDKTLQILDIKPHFKINKDFLQEKNVQTEKIKNGFRGSHLFNKLRKFSYIQILKSVNNNDFINIVSNFGHSINNNDFVEPLPQNEVNLTIKSIINYCLNNKTKIKNRKKKKEKKMNLDENINLKEKQQLGQQYMCKVRTTKTELKIQISIIEMKKQNLKINISTVSEYTKITRKTIRKYKDLLN